MSRPLSARLAALVLLAGGGLAACPAEETPPPPPPLGLEEGCQPLLAGADCFLPYPSDAFRVPDDTMPTGARIELGRAAKLATAAGNSADVNDWKKTDGFSRTAPIVTILGSPLSSDGLVGIFDDYEESTRPESRTILLDTETGALVPHFADLDPRADDPLRQALILRPIAGLEEQRRYVVALQGLTDPDGKAAPAPEGFRRLRDGVDVSNDPALAPLAARYDEEVFAPLAAAGVAPEELQLAWDFTTGSDAWATSDMLRARELALEALATEPPTVTIDSVEDEGLDAPLWRKIEGHIEGPLVLEDNAPGGQLARDEAGRVRLNGRARFPFTAVVPACVRDRYAPGTLLLYGHGFFGVRDEVTYGGSRAAFDRLCAVAVGIDWQGMATEDAFVVGGALGDQVWQTLAFSERVAQGMVNWLSLTAALEGALLDEAGFRRPDAAGTPGVVEDPQSPGSTNAGALLYDPGSVGYLGISQGHILGGIMVALNPRVERAILHVGGASFTNMMFRARPFNQFLGLLSLSVPDPLEQQKVVASLQRHFDPIDPATWSRFVLEDELPSGPPGGAEARRVLMQIALADTSVPNFASFLHARMLGLSTVGAQPVELFGIENVAGPTEGSGLSVYDLGEDPSFAAEAVPPAEETRSHEALRRAEPALLQMETFLYEGRIEHPCEGPCLIE